MSFENIPKSLEKYSGAFFHNPLASEIKLTIKWAKKKNFPVIIQETDSKALIEYFKISDLNYKSLYFFETYKEVFSKVKELYPIKTQN